MKLEGPITTTDLGRVMALVARAKKAEARVAELEAALREVLDMQCHAPAESETHCARGARSCAVCRVWPYLRGERR